MVYSILNILLHGIVSISDIASQFSPVHEHIAHQTLRRCVKGFMHTGFVQICDGGSIACHLI